MRTCPCRCAEVEAAEATIAILRLALDDAQSRLARTRKALGTAVDVIDAERGLCQGCGRPSVEPVHTRACLGMFADIEKERP